MAMCNAEILKRIKLLEQNKSDVISEESRIHQVSYQEEKDRYDYGYSFSKTRETINGLDEEIRKLKHLLNISNATTTVPEFSMTLGECLVYLAQLNRELAIVSRMAKKESTTTKSTFGGKVEYTVLNYNKEECQAKLEWLQNTIAQLQIAIDRTNLTNMIEVD
jgi:predicted  nucleic acid-binding Zn-ribbon protein